MADDHFLLLSEIEDLLLIEDPEAALLLANFPREVLSTYDATKPKFEFDSQTNAECMKFFRFGKDDFRRLKTALALPPRFVLPNRCVVDGLDALCIFLARLAYPCRLAQLQLMFNRPESTLSFIITSVLNFIYDNHANKVQDLDQDWIRRRRQTYADHIHNKGSPMDNIIGFIDGTVRPICRPTYFQRVVYNGHKRVHALKFQSIVSPDGLILNLYGPVEGRRHDSAMLQQSDVLHQFEQGNWIDRNGSKFAIYGDPAYPIRECLAAPFRNPTNELEELFNRRMSAVRICVEWQFGKLLTEFAFLDFKKNLKIFLQPVAKLYIVAAILLNCRTCLYGCQTSEFFELDPPQLEEYLA